MSRLLPPHFLLPSRRLFTTTTIRPAFANGPAPPRLPPKEQEEFERLQRASTGAFSSPRPSVIINPTTSSASSRSRPNVNQSSKSTPSSPQTVKQSPTSSQRPQINQSPALNLKETDVEIAAVDARVQATGNGEELHPDIRRGAKPEFEGDVNPLTGEVGGPKNDPLRWGSTGERGDWSYNGRVTDF